MMAKSGWNLQSVRNRFLNFFQQHGHLCVPSAPLLAQDDPTLLFTTAGMNPFKKYFLGQLLPPHPTITSAQACLRAGGKHNDLEQVGYTQRHHTYFEMLGNFSFGEYGKREAIAYAWELLTGKDGFHLPIDRLWVTVYYQDLETRRLWETTTPLPAQKIIMIGDKATPFDSDNFWQMGDTGPCGPCTEIFYDCGDQYPGTHPGDEVTAGTRFVEIWNLVFMQYQRMPNGQMHPLPALCIDTGMGLERMTAILQQVYDNYEIDTFVSLKQMIAQKAYPIPKAVGTHQSEIALRVIADHLRASFFMICEGILPTNHAHGYVLRRIIRRAIRYGLKIGLKKPFLGDLILPAAQFFRDEKCIFSSEMQKKLCATVSDEEALFQKTLQAGLLRLSKILSHPIQRLEGEQIFQLYDTYGFPFDMTREICQEQGVTVDATGFEQALAIQKSRSLQFNLFKTQLSTNTTKTALPETLFFGYENLNLTTELLGILNNDTHWVNELQEGNPACIVLRETPFYAESGGQIGDIGTIKTVTGTFEVHKTFYQGHLIFHQGHLTAGSLKLQQAAEASVQAEVRQQIAIHHSATHLLHSALQIHLGPQVLQAGSLVTADSLRLDFPHNGPVPIETLKIIECWINRQLCTAYRTEISEMSLEAAKSMGAVGLFENKYKNKNLVRVITLSPNCKELCGGTHVEYLRQVGYFKLLSESGLAHGMRRIEACAGPRAIEHSWLTHKNITCIAQQLKVSSENLLPQLNNRLAEITELKEAGRRANRRVSDWLLAHYLKSNILTIQTLRCIVKTLPLSEVMVLKTLAQQLIKEKSADCAILVGDGQESPCYFVIATAPQAIPQLAADQFLRQLALQISVRGGGKAHLAQGQIPDRKMLPTLIGCIKQLLHTKLESQAGNT